jgi:hypothetical protein
MDILNFCNDHKIRCFGYDWMMNQFITNKDLNIDFHHHLPAFVFYLNDHHIYLINDKDVRHALLNCNKTVDVTALANEKKQKIFTKYLLIDIPKEEWANHHKTNIYITDTRVVHNTFYILACAGDVYNVGIKMSEKEGITRYENGNMIYFNPDIEAVIQTIQILNHDLDMRRGAPASAQADACQADDVEVADDIRASGAGLPASAAKADARLRADDEDISKINMSSKIEEFTH